VNIWGFRPKNAKNCQNFELFSPAEANPLSDIDEIRKIYAGNRSTKAVDIWCDLFNKLGIYRQKTAMGWVFFVFVCLFVTLWVFNRASFIQIAILSPFVGQF